MRGMRMGIVCKVMEMLWWSCGGGSTRLRGYDMFMVGHAGQSFRLVLPFGQESGGFQTPGLLRDRPTDGAAWVAEICAGFSAVLCAVLCGFLRGIACRFWRMVTRVSLSDWLAFQARIRGSKDPRLLRDRPTDGAAMVL